MKSLRWLPTRKATGKAQSCLERPQVCGSVISPTSGGKHWIWKPVCYASKTQKSGAIVVIPLHAGFLIGWLDNPEA